MLDHASHDSPLIVGIGGTVRSDSSSETMMRLALAAAEAGGARTICLTALDIALPFYEGGSTRTPAAERLTDALRQADGLIIASPGYHGSISGLVKNALDYAEDLAYDDRPYLDGLPVGCLGVAYGKQAAVAVVDQLRTVTHALRGFPTPYGAAVVVEPGVFVGGQCGDAALAAQAALVGSQVTSFARATRPAAARLARVDLSGS